MKKYDCIFAGEICIDFPLSPLSLHTPLIEQAPIVLSAMDYVAGGIVSNGSMVFSRLGLKAAAFACVGQDVWADVLLAKLQQVGVDVSSIISIPLASSMCFIFIENGEHCFAYQAGACQSLNAEMLQANLALFEQSHYLMLGYYGLMKSLTPDLPDVLPQVKETGCRIALDAAFGGGKLQPLDSILPHLDLYIPSYEEAHNQTGEGEPVAMLECFRRYTSATTILGIKLGENGALISPHKNEYITISPIKPPSDIIDTTGAGDSFYAGFIAGLIKGYDVEEAAKIASAAGACSVTGIGAIAGIRPFEQTCTLAGVKG